jgi:hypothetical protein
MLIESLAGHVAVRRRFVMLRFGDTVSDPLLSGMLFGFAACGAFAGHPQIDDLSHAGARSFLRIARGEVSVPVRQRVRNNCADKVAMVMGHAWMCMTGASQVR